MSVVFADTSYFLALLSNTDQWHAKSLALSRVRLGRLVTTSWVLLELGDGLSDHRTRQGFVDLLAALKMDPSTVVVPLDEAIFAEAIALYTQRQDKDWSLTDCTSFIIMREQNITDVLTADHHFEQAGFKIMLK
jgi:hypothetical protein